VSCWPPWLIGIFVSRFASGKLAGWEEIGFDQSNFLDSHTYNGRTRLVVKTKRKYLSQKVGHNDVLPLTLCGPERHLSVLLEFSKVVT
jgi:hypothetical protein